MEVQPNSNTVGVLNEFSLHSQLKDYYSNDNGLVEQNVENYVIDVVKGKELIEIQSKNFSQIKFKLLDLLKKEFQVKLVYPLIIEKHYITDNQISIKKRKSPKKGNLFDLFNELVYIPSLLLYPNFTLEVLLISVSEERKAITNNFKKRKKYKTINRSLMNIKKKFIFNSPQDLLFILPYTLENSFSTKELMLALHTNNYKLVSKLVYVFKKLFLIEQVSKIGNRIYYQIVVN